MKVYDCLDCGFIGDWTAAGDTCPRCRGNDIATKEKSDL